MIKEKKGIHMSSIKRNYYGPISDFGVVSDDCLNKMIIRIVIESDLKVQRQRQGHDEKDVYSSNLIKRCGIIKDLKRRILQYRKSGKKSQ